MWLEHLLSREQLKRLLFVINYKIYRVLKCESLVLTISQRKESATSKDEKYLTEEFNNIMRVERD